VLGKI